jgi:hypothetical protein
VLVVIFVSRSSIKWRRVKGRMTDILCYISFCQILHDKDDEVEAPGHVIQSGPVPHLPLCIYAQI